MQTVTDETKGNTHGKRQKINENRISKQTHTQTKETKNKQKTRCDIRK